MTWTFKHLQQDSRRQGNLHRDATNTSFQSLTFLWTLQTNLSMVFGERFWLLSGLGFPRPGTLIQGSVSKGKVVVWADQNRSLAIGGTRVKKRRGWSIACFLICHYFIFFFFYSQSVILKYCDAHNQCGDTDTKK